MNENIHPLVAGWVDGLNNQKNPLHIRENYYNTLVAIKNVIDVAIARFEANRTKINTEIFHKKVH